MASSAKQLCLVVGTPRGFTRWEKTSGSLFIIDVNHLLLCLSFMALNTVSTLADCIVVSCLRHFLFGQSSNLQNFLIQTLNKTRNTRLYTNHMAAKNLEQCVLNSPRSHHQTAQADMCIAHCARLTCALHIVQGPKQVKLLKDISIFGRNASPWLI